MSWWSTPQRILFIPITVAVLSPLAACGEGDGDGGQVSPATTTGATTTVDETTTTTAPDTGPPGQIAAVLGDGRLVVLNGANGEVERTLLEGIDVNDPASNGIALSPDGDDVFVVRPRTGGAGGPEILRVPISGGESEVIGPGRAPSLSPDGTTLAYNDLEQGERPLPVPLIVLRDLETGEERRLRRVHEPQFPFIVETAWTADGDDIAFIAGEIQTALYLLSVEADDLDQARRLGPEAPGEDTSWVAVAALGDQRLAVAEACCGVPDPERWQVIAVDRETGTVEGTLLSQERVEASRIDADVSTRHLVIVAQLQPGGGRLLRWSPAKPPAAQPGPAGELQELRDDVVVAAW